MDLKNVVETVESGEQDAILKVLQIYNQEVSVVFVLGLCQSSAFPVYVSGSRLAGEAVLWDFCATQLAPFVSSTYICLCVTSIKLPLTCLAGKSFVCSISGSCMYVLTVTVPEHLVNISPSCFPYVLEVKHSGWIFRIKGARETWQGNECPCGG